jgi:hypothetical protein
MFVAQVGKNETEQKNDGVQIDMHFILIPL